MGKNRWTALILALVLIITALPVFAGAASRQEDNYGGLAPWETPSSERPSRPAGSGDYGGLAPSQFEGSSQPTRPAGDGDYDGLAPTEKVETPKPVTRPAGSGDYGGLAPEGNSSGNQASRPAGSGDNGGLAPVPETPGQASRPAANGDYGGLAPTEFEGSNQPTRPAGEGDYGGLAPTQTSPGKKKRDTDKIAGLTGQVIAGVSLITNSHTAYAYGSGGAFASFHPTRQVTRAEASQMLLRLLPEQPPVSGVIYTDVPESAWYAGAVKTMAALGVLEPQNGELDPGREISRGEFTRFIACFSPLRTDAELFPDVSEDDPNAPFIRSARAWGWAQGGKDGLFHPEELINRAAAVVLLNRALGRTADRAYIDRNHPTFYVDVAPSSWYYYDVMEATVSHQHSAAGGETWTAHTSKTEIPIDGPQLVDGWLYCYDSTRGDVVRDAAVGTRYYNALGHFTTGNNELDSWLHKIVLAHTDASMTQEQKLRALFLYTRDSFTYLRRSPYAFGVYDYMETDALRILETGYGNCYCYAALYWYLTRWIGYDSVIYNGTVGVRRSPHSWVEINLDGKNYIFDTELEMAYRRKKRFDINLYKFYDAGNSWNYVRPKHGGVQM